MCFRSDAPTAALTGYNIYVTTPTDPTTPWGTPVVVQNVSSALAGGPSCATRGT